MVTEQLARRSHRYDTTEALMRKQEHGSEETARPQTIPAVWQPRFGIGSLLLVMFIFSAMGSAGFYLVRGLEGSRGFQLAFILFTLAAPVLLVVVVSLLRVVYDWINARRRR